MSIKKVLEKIKKLSWVKIATEKAGFLKGHILKDNGKIKTEFTMEIEETGLQLIEEDGKQMVDFIAEEMNIPYLQVNTNSWFDKLNIYMWEENDEKFKRLHDEYAKIVENNKNNMFGYKGIHLLVPPSAQKHKRRSY